MKIKVDFVTNSSSTSFYITNTSNKTLKMVDFVKENIHLVDEFNHEYSCTEKKEDAIRDSETCQAYNYVFKAGETKEVTFGDEDGTALGRVYDYILREGGSSKNFDWEFKEYLR